MTCKIALIFFVPPLRRAMLISSFCCDPFFPFQVSIGLFSTRKSGQDNTQRRDELFAFNRLLDGSDGTLRPQPEN